MSYRQPARMSPTTGSVQETAREEGVRSCWMPRSDLGAGNASADFRIVVISYSISFDSGEGAKDAGYGVQFAIPGRLDDYRQIDSKGLAC